MRGWVLAVVLAGVGAQAAPEAGAAVESCPHPYFPMNEGLTLTYRAGKSEVKVRMSDVVREGASWRARLNLEHKGQKGFTDASCGAEGISTLTGGLEAAALRMSGMNVNIVSSEGVLLPAPGGLVPGGVWHNVVALELKPPEGSKIPLGAVRSSFKREAVVEGPEQIEVAGKTWDALRVKNKVTAMSGTIGERSIESTMWIAKDVGILRIQTGETVDFELLGIEGGTKAKASTKAGEAARAQRVKAPEPEPAPAGQGAQP